MQHVNVNKNLQNVNKNLQKDSSIEREVFLPKHLAKQEPGFVGDKLEMIWKALEGRCRLKWKFHTTKLIIPEKFKILRRI